MRSLLVAGTRLAYPGIMRILTVLAFVLGAALFGAAPASTAEFQTLEIASRNGVHPFMVEIATNDEERARGLMYRKELPEGQGMLFDFKRDQEVSMWMKNTYVSLDMIFIRADGSIDRIAENTIPESLEPVVSGGEVSAVLELAGGTAARLGIDETAKVTWKD